ncbi:MAG: prolyl oligopeptidase family serine peptidase [Anaerolineales bacterium]|nr:prolyl oligopeptidase family serine peptidase [Anaerolineales bacterium]
MLTAKTHTVWPFGQDAKFYIISWRSRSVCRWRQLRRLYDPVDLGHTHQFKSAVAQRVVSNFVSMWGSSDLNWIFQQVLGNKPPWEDLERIWKHSPMAYIGNANTPTLIVHSEHDHRCPIEQGEQAFVALKTLGVDTEMVRFPGEPHGLSRLGRTDRRIVRLNHILRWMDKYLKKDVM